MEKLRMIPSDKGLIPPGTVHAGVNVRGETLYIGQYAPHHPFNNEYPFGIITPSQEMIVYCDYSNTSDKELSLKLCVRYEALAGKDSVVLYWKPCDEYFLKAPKYFPEDIVFSNKTRKSLLYFVAQIDPNIITESKVVGKYNKSKFPADFYGPLVGVGHAWYVEGTCEQGHRTPITSFNAYVPYDGKIYEVSKFSFLCSRQLPRLSHITHPRDEWVKIFSHDLPPNAFPAGIAPNGEVIYVGRAERLNDEPDADKLDPYNEIPGHVTPSYMHLHITWKFLEHIYDSNDGFEMLVEETQDLLEWVVCSLGRVPRNAVIAGVGKFTGFYITYYIGRTVTGSDLSVGKTFSGAPIKLPDSRVYNTQLVGKIDRLYGNSLCVAWNGDEYLYNKFEVLVLKKKFSPKNLQRLCRNAIIILTRGMPHIVNQLDLPAQLKEFCKVTGNKVD
ncbi:uncharacterized protein [Dysidea avara]|uniref:uncharacterized protein isoform X2 n=1 Tax=Dysidea avara TaxID=196820 RepID=UPI00332693FA